MPAEIEVRRVVPADWPAQALRLEALADAPVAVGRRAGCWVAAVAGAREQRPGRRGVLPARFLATGHREPYPPDLTTHEVELARPLR